MQAALEAGASRCLNEDGVTGAGIDSAAAAVAGAAVAGVRHDPFGGKRIEEASEPCRGFVGLHERCANRKIASTRRRIGQVAALAPARAAMPLRIDAETAP